MDLVQDVARLIFSPEGSYQGTRSYPLAVFALACGAMGSAVVVLDWVVVQAGRTSSLKLIYRRYNVIWLALLWGAGAGIGGFLGAAFGILQLNRVAAITVGVAWPLILPRLIRSSESTLEDVEEIEDKKP